MAFAAGSLPAPVEIHQQEGEIVERVGGRDVLVELDRVEQHRFAVQDHDVVEMQVAMASTDEASLSAPVEARTDDPELPMRLVPDLLGSRPSERSEDAINQLRQPVDPSSPRLNASGAMTVEDGIGNVTSERGCDLAALGERAKQ